MGSSVSRSVNRSVYVCVVLFSSVLLAALAVWSAAPAGGAPLDPATTESRTSGQDVVQEARRHLGTRVSSNPCRPFRNEYPSCLHRSVFAKFGVRLPIELRKQVGYGKAVPKSRLRPGDVLYFDTFGDRAIDYAGIYSGSGNMVQASGYYTKVVEKPVKYTEGYRTAKRLPIR